MYINHNNITPASGVCGYARPHTRGAADLLLWCSTRPPRVSVLKTIEAAGRLLCYEVTLT